MGSPMPSGGFGGSAYLGANTFWAGIERDTGDEGPGTSAAPLECAGSISSPSASGQVKPRGLRADSRSGKLWWEYIEASFSCIPLSPLASFFWSTAQKQREGKRRWWVPGGGVISAWRQGSYPARINTSPKERKKENFALLLTPCLPKYQITVIKN